MVYLTLLNSESFAVLNVSGMEGGPVFSEHAQFIGILIRPLRQKSSGAEIQVTWKPLHFKLFKLSGC